MEKGMNIQRFCLATLVLLFPTVASTQSMYPLNEGVVPVVVRNPGENDSTWTTSLYVTQVSGPSAAKVILTILDPDGADWSSTINLPSPRGATQVVDVVSSVDESIPDGKYILSWWSSQPVIISTRTFTDEATGSYGQGIMSVEPGSGFFTNGQVLFPAPMDFDSHRVNVGIANTGASDQVFAIEAVDAVGGVISSWSRTVAAESIAQLRTNDDLRGIGSVAVRCIAGCDGNAFAYASVVVNDSNDAFFMYAGAEASSESHVPVATTRDTEGVWHITGGALYDVFEAMGYAVACDRLWQAETYRRQARGTLAESFGSGYVDNDVFVRITGYSDEELSQAFTALDGESKTVLQGYVDGFNRRIAEVRANESLLPYEFTAVGQALGRPFVPDNWTVIDVLAWIVRLQRNYDCEASGTGIVDNAALLQDLAAAYPSVYSDMFNDLLWINDPAAQTMIPEPSSAAASALPRVDVSTLPDLRGAAERMRAARDARIARLEQINATVKMGSFAWVVSGEKTRTGHPILYSGPQMGLSTPSIVLEGSIRGGGLNVSGMTVAGVPGIVIGRTPHHAWSMQMGHAHSVDYYIESAEDVTLHRMETVHVAGGDDVIIPVYRSVHGPVVEPMPYDPGNPSSTILSWKYANWGHEFDIVGFSLGVARATSIDDFGEAIELFGSSDHFCYADRDGNIAYWMTGRDPVRPAGLETRLPLPSDGTAEWDATVLKPRYHDLNPDPGYYGGWNNKAAASADNPPNNWVFANGVAHRAHVIDEFLASAQNLSFDEVRDLALNIATTDSFGGGGTSWAFVEDRFSAAVVADSTAEREAALALLDEWDGHFVLGGESSWANGAYRAEAWLLQNGWIEEMIRLTFADELDSNGLDMSDMPTRLLYDVLLHALAGASASVPTLYDWFQDQSNSGKPTTADELIVLALDNTLDALGSRPWMASRGSFSWTHAILGDVSAAPTPFANRSTYAQCVEIGSEGPLRIESMFPLGQSGTILIDSFGEPVFDENFLSMHDVYNSFEPRPFPVFK